MKPARVLIPILFLTAAAPLIPAQSGADCPDVRASEVAARIDRFGATERCGLGVVVLGLPLSIGGAKCYRNEVTYPAHQECDGVHNAGTQCLTEATLPVTLRRCECQWFSALGTGLAVPKCSCSDSGNLGTIEDFQTVECHVVHG